MPALNELHSQVDVVIPAHNAEKYIDATLESVVLQGSIVRSIIVVNDGSTDQTEDVIHAFSKKHPTSNIVYLKQANQGLANARNTGIRASNAPYIALLDSDDVWLAQKLEKQLAIFHRSPPDSPLKVVYCGYQLINENSTLIDDEKLLLKPKLRGNIFSKLLNGNFVSSSGSGVLIKSEIFQEIGYFDESLNASEDWDMWIRIAKKYHYDYVNEPLVHIRVHSRNMQKDFSRMLASELAMLNKFAQQGTHNYFLLWKIQTILFQKKMLPEQIDGFIISDPWVKTQLSGNQRRVFHLFLTVADAIWRPLQNLKRYYL